MLELRALCVLLASVYCHALPPTPSRPWRQTDLIEMTGVQCVGSWQVALLCAERLQLRDSRGKGKLELHMSQGARPVGTVRFGGVSWAPPRVLLWFWSWYKPQVTWESRIREQRILPPSIISHGGKYPPHGFKRGAQGHSTSQGTEPHVGP